VDGKNAFCSSRLRLIGADANGERALRIRKGRFYRRDEIEGRSLSNSGRRDDLPGRDRGAAPGDAGEITPCVAGKRSATSGQQREGKCRCSCDRGDKSRSGGRLSRRNLPKGLVFSTKRGDRAPPSPARAPVGHSGPGSPFPGSLRQGLAHTGYRCGDEEPAAL